MNPSLLLETDAAQIVFVVVQLGASGILQGAIVEVEERRYEGCHVPALEIRWIMRYVDARDRGCAKMFRQ